MRALPAAVILGLSLSCTSAPKRPPDGGAAAGDEAEVAPAPAAADAPRATERPAPPADAARPDGDAPRVDPEDHAGDPPPGARRAWSAATLRDAVRGVASGAGAPTERAARALEAIAALIPSGDSADARAAVGAMQREIRALERLDAVDLDRADRVKAALEHGIEAMRAVARGRGAGWLEAWIDAAAAAVDGIEPAKPLGLQRAPVQDALRALADAVIVAG